MSGRAPPAETAFGFDAMSTLETVHEGVSAARGGGGGVGRWCHFRGSERARRPWEGGARAALMRDMRHVLTGAGGVRVLALQDDQGGNGSPQGWWAAKPQRGCKTMGARADGSGSQPDLGPRFRVPWPISPTCCCSILFWTPLFLFWVCFAPNSFSVFSFRCCFFGCHFLWSVRCETVCLPRLGPVHRQLPRQQGRSSATETEHK